ncbi:glycosyltransferase family 4 protein [Peribacillus sp. FSL E2-0159]|uniref:glycosyltransferase family 4 protein n=1 Tax=Peribacillus sp. FSL E2-0159 TaxID=2975289 RepID=UPI00315AADA6
MHIVMLISSFHPLIGGAERQALRLSEKLVDSGIRVTVLTRWHEGLRKEEKINGVNVNRIKVSKNPKLAPVIFLIKTLKFIRENKNDIDIIHAHALSAPGLTAAVASRLFKIPSIAKIAGGGNKDGCEIIRISRSGILGKLKVIFMKKNISKFIAISKLIEKDLLKVKVPESKIVFLPNGIDLDKFAPIKNNNIDNEKINKFAFIGRLEKIKGIDVLLNTWESMSKEFLSKNKLLIAGDGREKHFLENMDSSIEHLGKVDDVLKLLNEIDIFILPSRYEGISNSLLEAMATEKIIIASEVGGNPDLLINNLNGYLFENENIDQLRKLFKYTSENIIELNGVGKEARATLVKNGFDLSEIQSKYRHIYNELTQKKNA